MKEGRDALLSTLTQGRPRAAWAFGYCYDYDGCDVVHDYDDDDASSMMTWLRAAWAFGYCYDYDDCDVVHDYDDDD